MTKPNTHISISFDRTTNIVGSECSGVLFEIPQVDVIGGQEIDIVLWGADYQELGKYTIFQATSSLGGGTTVTVPEEEITEDVDFAETSKVQCKWPIAGINSATALSEISYIEDDDVLSWASDGALITNRVSKIGYSCIGVASGENIYGTIRLKYNRTKCTRRWKWVVPVNKASTYWFFIKREGKIKNKFSINVPDLVDGAPVPRDILLRIVSRGEGATIPGTSVYIDGELKGVTDANGLLAINGIMTGTYPLRLTSPGFLPSDADNLLNDNLTVY